MCSTKKTTRMISRWIFIEIYNVDGNTVLVCQCVDHSALNEYIVCNTYTITHNYLPYALLTLVHTLLSIHKYKSPIVIDC